MENKTGTFALYDLLTKYDKRFRPNFRGSNVRVIVQMYVNGLSSISDSEMDYKLIFFLRQRWNDPRLRYGDFEPEVTQPFVTLDESALADLWVPDIFFENGKGAAYPEGKEHTTLIRIYPSGDILFTRKLSFLLSCPMNFQTFPFDTQSCGIQMESYGYTTDDLSLEWAEPEPLEINSNIRLPEYDLGDWKSFQCDVKYLTGTFSCVKATFILTRRFEHYILQAFLPCIFLVILSWMSFWISPDSVPARVALGITTMLASITLSSYSNGATPRLSYTRAIDIYMLTCAVFVFSTVVEFALVHYVFRRRSRFAGPLGRLLRYDNKAVLAVPQLVKITMKEPNHNDVPEWSVAHAQERHDKMAADDVISIHVNLASKMDVVSRILFPTLFLVFNIAFWCKYVM
ncbi:glycine receptor subunit alpha-3-like [Branchiostoma floridae x Branchiostoma japonicum]